MDILSISNRGCMYNGVEDHIIRYKLPEPEFSRSIIDNGINRNIAIEYESKINYMFASDVDIISKYNLIIGSSDNIIEIIRRIPSIINDYIPIFENKEEVIKLHNYLMKNYFQIDENGIQTPTFDVSLGQVILNISENISKKFGGSPVLWVCEIILHLKNDNVYSILCTFIDFLD